MPNRVTILVIVLALLLFGSSAALAEKNWALKQIPIFVDSFLEEMDPSLMRMEAQIATMEKVSRKNTTDIQVLLRHLILYKTVVHAANDIEDLAPWSKSGEVEDKMELVKTIAEAHYSDDRKTLENYLWQILVQKRKQVEAHKEGAEIIDVFQQLQDIMDDLDDEIKDAYMESKHRPQTFREI